MMQEQFFRRKLYKERMYGSSRGGYRKPKKEKKKNTDEQRLIDPKNFSQVYKNPLADLLPLLQYFTGIQVQKQGREGSRPFQRQQQYRRMMMRRQRERQRRMYDEESQEQIEKPAKKNPILSLIAQKGRNIPTFQGYRKDIMSKLNRDKQSMRMSRITNVGFIQDKLHFDLRSYNLLDQKKIDSRWEKIEKIMSDKLKIIESSFQKNIPLLQMTKPYQQFIVKILNQKKQIKLFKNLDPNQQFSVFTLILYYLAIPSEQKFHSQIISYSQKSNSIFKKLFDEQQELRRIVISLPYKQSSFYWGKIIDCCRSISDVDHYSYLNKTRVESFEAEYGGTITNQVLKRLQENQWLDNTITSAVIEYLKNIEGANNYHNDNNYKAFIFNHSQTDIYLNGRGGQNYLAYQKLIFLINHNNNHWSVITAYLNNGDLVVYDSLGGQKEHQDYCEKIINKLKNQSKRKKSFEVDLQIAVDTSPRQTNTSDCGVFAIVNMICAFDKQKKQQIRNKYSNDIICQIRNSLLLFLLYLGYCKRYQVVPRKDYFDILFRSTIHYNMKSKLHEERRK